MAKAKNVKKKTLRSEKERLDYYRARCKALEDTIAEMINRITDRTGRETR